MFTGDGKTIDVKRPDLPKGSHPVITDDYQVPTNEIVRVLSSVSRWIELRTTGATIYGRPRLGKTWMIKYLVKNIPLVFNQPIPVHHIVNIHSKIAKEEELIETILTDMSHDLALVGKLSSKRQRLIDFLASQAVATSRRVVILFIDEAQCLGPNHYDWLSDYYNKLDKMKITLTVFLVGQEQLHSQKVVFAREHSDQIIERFMLEEYHFSGIKTLEDIQIFLRCYDEASEFPPNSGWTFTRYFFPEAFAAGERLQNFAKDIFEIFIALRQKQNIKGTFEIPMQYIVKAIKIIFLDYGRDSPSHTEWISKSQWLLAIQKSNYIASEQRKKVSKDK
jgi:type II secretory pathway predicted ATPase ExeA